MPPQQTTPSQVPQVIPKHNAHRVITPPAPAQPPVNPTPNGPPANTAPLAAEHASPRPVSPAPAAASAANPPVAAPAAGSGQKPGPPPGPPPRQRVVGNPTEIAKKRAGSTAQQSLLIAEIRDGIVIMRDGSLRGIVMCQSINFDLMSPEEREGIEYGYQSFLNSLYFDIQIFIRSQHVDLNSYLERLEKIRQNQDNILLGLLMEDYIAYVRYLTEAANIMDKQFYVAVPYYPTVASKEGISTGAKKFSELFNAKPTGVVTVDEANFRRYKQELAQQMRVVTNGLSQIGVQAIPLNTQELIELYYNIYNPVTAKNEKLTDINELEAPIIQKGEGEAKQVMHGGPV